MGLHPAGKPPHHSARNQEQYPSRALEIQEKNQWGNILHGEVDYISPKEIRTSTWEDHVKITLRQARYCAKSAHVGDLLRNEGGVAAGAVVDD